MSLEENVDEMHQTEEIVETKTEEASTVLGKFKDVDALAKAYEALEAEFTRRSQRLRSLEKEMENFKSQEKESSGAEKLRKTAKARREENRAFDEFVAEVDSRQGEEKPVQDTPLATEAPSSSGESPRGEEKKGERAVGEYGDEKEELFKRAVANDEVRLRIVGEYLSSLGKTGAPMTGRGAGVLSTPPVRAKTVGQAGDMALLYFRKPLEG